MQSLTCFVVSFELEVGFLECGCPTRPDPLPNTVSCSFGCTYEELPDPFRYDFFEDITCAMAFTSTIHPEDASDCSFAQSLSDFCCEERGAVPSNGCQMCPDGTRSFESDPNSYSALCPELVANAPYLLEAGSLDCKELQAEFALECGCVKDCRAGGSLFLFGKDC